MKSMISKTLALVTICATLFSFSPKPGGEGFEIFLDNKVLIQQFGSDMNTVKALQLDQRLVAGQLTIKYYHCGKAGRNRVITIKDRQNNVLKEFRYADAVIPVAAMALPVKDILKLKKGNDAVLKLFYASGELPNGRLLAMISL